LFPAERLTMFYSTRSKLIASFLGVALLVGAVSLFIGVRLLNKHVLGEAANRVRLDLNAAGEMYQTRIKFVRISLNITTLGFGFVSALKAQDTSDLVNRLERMARQAELDFAGVVAPDGRTICRIGPNALAQTKTPASNPITGPAIDRRIPIAGTVIMSRDFLTAENPELAERARIPLVTLPEDSATVETSGMAIAAAIPVFDREALIGVLYGGILLNRSENLVDTLRETVFQGEIYQGRSIGTATIFLNDIRISTNVMTPEGKRAIGTRVSPQVKEDVLNQGRRWTDRAFVVSDWYITAYEPIEDISGRRVGMLYVGVLEDKYTEIQHKAIAVFILITVIGMALATALGYVLAAKIMKPVHHLIKASQQVSEGSLTPDIGEISKGEIGLLQKTFKEMVDAMGRRRAASEDRIIQSEKQASVGRLAAGVAHEINNPLTGVLTYTHMLLRRKDIATDMRSDLETIAAATERVRKIVKGLLDFSRQTKLDPEPTEVNRLVRAAITLIENQALVKGVSIKFTPGESLPPVTLDRSQMQSVLINMIINALDATDPGGNIKVFTAAGLSGNGAGQKGVEITVADTGCGIPPENLDKLFDPFFTTKAVGQGTGLGLSVSYGIVQRHGGHIRVQSEVGKGSRFFIWLPVERRAE
jgi:two-component system NtrC family sensor kinase